MRKITSSMFWHRTRQTDSCWLWLDTKDRDGYGKLAGSMAHRYAYELLVGPISPGLQLDHLCRVRLCVNPDHLDPVTPRENSMRSLSVAARNASATHCVHGHPFDEQNTHRYLRNGRVVRSCRTCNRLAVTRSKQRKQT